MSPLRIHIEGIGLWSKHLGNYAALQSLLVGDTPEPPLSKPAATTLPPNERRRAPESVLLAVEVAGQAVDAGSRCISWSTSSGFMRSSTSRSLKVKLNSSCLA